MAGHSSPPHPSHRPHPSELVEPYDEMVEGETPRPSHRALHEILTNFGPTDLNERARQRDAYLDRHGITFSLAGRERPLPLDLVPRLITTDEWAVIEAGIIQRIRALEAFLADVYSEGAIMREGVIPRALVASSTHYHRQAWGIEPVNGVRIHVSGSDLIRDENGQFRVLEDNLRNPSGVSYVLENRRTLAHVLPEIFIKHRVKSVNEYPEKLLDALRAAAPAQVDEPTVVVLTPGVHNSAHYEHAFLARRMGVELVEGRDLYCRDQTVWMRTTAGPRPVHVIYRRIDDEFLDPLHMRADSVLGVPGLLNVARAQRVSIANGIGNGVADDKAVYPYVPEFIRYYLGQEPILDNVETFDLADPDHRALVFERMDRMVIKPADGSGGYGLVMGPDASDEQLEVVRRDIEADPRGWIAQPVITFSTCPTVVDEGAVEPRHVDLRPFAVNDGENVYVLPGGLSRVALPRGSLVVNSSQGGGSKDTWVLDEDGPRVVAPPAVPRAVVLETEAPARLDAPNQHEDRLVQQERQQQQERSC